MIRRRHLFVLPPAIAVAWEAASASGQSPIPSSGELLRGRFTQQRTLQGFKTPLTSAGTFIVAPGRGVVWRTDMPFAVVTAIGSGGLVQRVSGGATTHYPASRLPAIARLYEIFAAALGGDWLKLDRLFAVQREGGDQSWKVTLKPLSEDPTLPIRLVIVQGGRYVNSVEIQRANGDSDRIDFTDQALSRTPLDGETTELLATVNRA